MKLNEFAHSRDPPRKRDVGYSGGRYERFLFKGEPIKQRWGGTDAANG